MKMSKLVSNNYLYTLAPSHAFVRIDKFLGLKAFELNLLTDCPDATPKCKCAPVVQAS